MRAELVALGDETVKSVLRHCRPPAPKFASEFASSRSVARKFASQCASVPPGTPAYAFVALHAPRLSSVQRHHLSLSRSVGLCLRIETPPTTRCNACCPSRGEPLGGKRQRVFPSGLPKSSKRAVQQAALVRIEVYCGVGSKSVVFAFGSNRSSARFADVCAVRAGRDRSRRRCLGQMNSNGFGRVRSPSNELASIWSVGAERPPLGIA